MTEPISGKQKRALRARAHHLKPVIFVGAGGISPSVLAELEAALDAHELVKLRLHATDRLERRHIVETLCRRAHAVLVASIGRTAVIYRERHET